ncbi:hypothetical protein KQI65_03680 [bacterium]|nr:hypothetical protein [bacterium]
MKSERKRASFPTVLVIGAAAIALLYLLALLLPEGRLWGMDMLRYLQLPRGVPYAVIMLAAVGGLLWLTASRKVRPSIAAWIMLVVLLLAPGVDTFFYGDGPLLIPEIHRYSVTGDYNAALLLNTKSSPLAGWLLVFLMTTIPKITVEITTAMYPFFWLGKLCLAGAGLSIIALTSGKHRVYGGKHRVYALAALAASAGVLLLMGEVEFYAPVFAATAVYMVAAERVLRAKDAALWPAVLALIVAVLSHYMAIVLFPSLIFLLLRANSTLKNWGLKQGISAGRTIVAAGILVYLILSYVFPDNRILLPISRQVTDAGVNTYTALSFKHLADVLNLLLLLAPLSIVALVFFWRTELRKQEADAEYVFHALAALPFLGVLLVINASLGLARDWDLAAVTAVPLVYAALAAAERSTFRHAAPLFLALSIFLQLPWLLLHEQPRATAERFEHIMSLDDEHIYGDYALSGYDALRKFDYGAQDAEKEIAFTRRMVQLVGYPQHYRELVSLVQAHDAADPSQLLDALEWILLELNRDAGVAEERVDGKAYAFTLSQIDSLAQAVGMIAVAHGGLQRAKTRGQMQAIATRTRDGRAFPGVEAVALYQSRRYDSAAVKFEQALRQGFSSPTLYLFFGNALALSGQYSASLARLEEGVRQYPNDGMLRFTLGKYYLRAGIQLGRAAELLNWCVEHDNPPAHSSEARILLRQLQG